jgi:hypothetical protein
MMTHTRIIAGVAMTVTMGAGLGVSPVAARDDDDPTPNACTDQQIAGGYEDVDGQCLLTDWNGEYCNLPGGCDWGGCKTPICGGDPGEEAGPDGGGVPGSGADFDVHDFESFDRWCDGAGGRVHVSEIDWSDGDTTTIERGRVCIRDGQLIGNCSELDFGDGRNLSCREYDPPIEIPPGHFDDLVGPVPTMVDPNVPLGELADPASNHGGSTANPTAPAHEDGADGAGAGADDDGADDDGDGDAGDGDAGEVGAGEADPVGSVITEPVDITVDPCVSPIGLRGARRCEPAIETVNPAGWAPSS